MTYELREYLKDELKFMLSNKMHITQVYKFTFKINGTQGEDLFHSEWNVGVRHTENTKSS